VRKRRLGLGEKTVRFFHNGICNNKKDMGFICLERNKKRRKLALNLYNDREKGN